MEPPTTNTPRYRSQSRDTDEWADRMLFDHWRSMEPWQKARLVTQLCQAAHRLSMQGLASRHPSATHEELELRAACLRLGRKTVEQVLGHPLPFPE